MSPIDLVALVCCDLGAIMRGRSLLASELEEHLDVGVGWVPANHLLTPLGELAESGPFGSTGDLRLVADIDTRVRVESPSGESPLDFVLCDIVETDGQPWECCPRRFLRDALDQLEGELGAQLSSSFEHEFQLVLDVPAAPAFSLQALRGAEPFASELMGALVTAGAQPERFIAEYAPHQFEIPVRAAAGLAGADRSIALKEVVREIARRRGLRASFAPLFDPADAGNGLHIHLNLLDAAGRPLLYDSAQPACLSELGASFAAGILHHARALSALTAPNPTSAARLTPHRWSVGAVCLAERNREALLRIPPVLAIGEADPAAQLRLEYRGADATANPYLALGAIVRAGLDGVRRELPAPPLLDRDPSELDGAEADRFGVGALTRSLEDSLTALSQDDTVRGWLGELLYDAYVAVKRSELDAVADLELDDACQRYASIY